jgi:hypothetical protein
MRKLHGLFERSDGRIRLLTVLGVAGLAAALAIFLVMPAVAGTGLPSNAGVVPDPLDYGGGPGGCAAAGSQYTELHIANPTTGTFPSSDGAVSVTLQVNGDDTEFSYEFSDPKIAAYQITVNGGPKSLLFDNEAWNWPLNSDGGLHAPTKGNSLSNLYKLSHINLCYGEFTPSVSGVKFHDRDTDGIFDSDNNEEGLGGFTITAFDAQGNVALDANDAPATTTTAADGSYTLADLVPGTYTICEETTTNGLAQVVYGDPDEPTTGTGYAWAWTQSVLDGTTYPTWNENANCDQYDDPASSTFYESQGHTVTVTGNVTGVDFGHHTQVGIDCSTGDVTLVLGGMGTNDNPRATVVVPQGSPSCDGSTWYVSFDVGRSEDSDNWSQFVVFGDGSAPPASASIIEQTIVWDVEDAVYENGSLVVPTTKVLVPGVTGLSPIELCSSIDGGEPTTTTPVCLDSRTIDEGGSLPVGTIQVTDNNLLLGDPGFFR